MSELDNAIKFMKNFEGRNIFVAMRDDNSKPPIHYHRQLSDCMDILKRQNDKNLGIFFTVNELDRELDPSKQRTGKMWDKGRSLYLDDDIVRDQPRTDFPLVPNLIVSTSSGKYHYYWLISGGIENKGDYIEVQRSLVENYEGDGGVKDVTRYLRLPGFMHRKNNKETGKANDRFVTYIDNEVDKYEWSELEEAFGRISGSTSNSGTNNISAGSNRHARSIVDSKTLEEYNNLILSGSDYHLGLRNISFQYAKEGVEARYVINLLENLMNSVDSSLQDDRWLTRYTDIERIVRGAYESVHGLNVDLSSLDVAEIEYSGNELPWPPGLMGELADDAYNMAMYQYKEVALVSAIGLVAGICGRKFNVSDTGLNVYLTLLMKTGMGKDSISKFVTRILNDMNESGNSSSFLGAKRFTGPKAVINKLKDALSQVCVFTEAGILMRSQSGDQDGLTRLLLGLYSCSGQYDWSGSEEFSSSENGIPSLKAPALTIISEATPETLLSVLRDSGSLENGHLPRQSIFRLEGNKPYPNIKIKKKLTTAVDKRLRELITKCSAAQADNDFECWEFDYHHSIEKDIYEFSKYCVDKENGHRGEDNVKSIMASRMFLKALKYSAIASALNHKELLIKRPEWEWSKSMVEFEFMSIDGMFNGSGFNNVLEDLAKQVGRVIVKMLRDEYKDRKIALNKQKRDKQEIPYSNINQVLRKSKIFVYDHYISTPSDGLKRTLIYMVEAGYLRLVSADTGSDTSNGRIYGKGVHTAIYKPTENFILFMKE